MFSCAPPTIRRVMMWTIFMASRTFVIPVARRERKNTGAMRVASPRRATKGGIVFTPRSARKLFHKHDVRRKHGRQLLVIVDRIVAFHLDPFSGSR